MELRTEKDESIDAFLKRFRTSVQTTEAAGGKKVFLPDRKTVEKIDMSEVNAIIYQDNKQQETALKKKILE